MAVLSLVPPDYDSYPIVNMCPYPCSRTYTFVGDISLLIRIILPRTPRKSVLGALIPCMPCLSNFHFVQNALLARFMISNMRSVWCALHRTSVRPWRIGSCCVTRMQRVAERIRFAHAYSYYAHGSIDSQPIIRTCVLLFICSRQTILWKTILDSWFVWILIIYFRS